MTLLPETLYSIRVYTAEKVMEPPVEIRIAIVALSSPTDLPRIVCAGETETLVGRRRREIYEMKSRFISATLDLDRENSVRSRCGDISRFLCANVSMFCFPPVCFREARFINNYTFILEN